jgi:mannose-6-phosphate isomerase
MAELYPFKFKEIYKKYIWGGQGFEKIGKDVPGGVAAESWEIACHKDGMSVVMNGELHGKTLKELVEQYGKELLGSDVDAKEGNFPLMVKFINAKNKLSVQVHPNDEYARKHEGDSGKNEAWVILDAKEDSELIIGIKRGIDLKAFSKACENNEIEECLNKMKVKAGDVINIPAGLVHAIGSGIMLAEIQQNSNVTYRIYDYDRKDDKGNTRPLHIDKALEVIDFTLKDEDEKKAMLSKYFCLETYNITEDIKQVATGETFFIYIFTEGEGEIIYRDKKIRVAKGDTYLIPANLGEFELKGKLQFIKSYIPKKR